MTHMQTTIGQQNVSGSVWRQAWRGLGALRALAVVMVLALSLAANVTLFVGGVIYNTIDEAVERFTGLATETGTQRKAANRLKQDNRQLLDDKRKLKSDNTRLKNRTARVRRVTTAAVKRTLARSTRFAVRAVATMPGKAMPVVGTAVIVGATALEIKDICDTVRDMRSIQREVNPLDIHSEEESRVCGIEVPTQEKLLSQIDTAPREAWQRSREFLTDLDPIPSELKWEMWPNLLKGVGIQLQDLLFELTPDVFGTRTGEQ